MRHTKKYKIQTAVRVTVLWLFALICLAPFYVAVCYAFKSKTEFAKTKLAFPTTLYLQNFVDAFELKNYFNSVKNSAIVAICVVILIVIICSMSAYIITRKNNKFYNFIFYFFQMVILIPFQTIMFPLYRDYIFLYAGFIKSVPIALEEAAKIDGCDRYQVFVRIVFPLLKPITMTVVVLCFLASWNDFFLPLIMVQKDEVKTLPLMQFFFFGEYTSNINLAFAASILSMIPAVAVYFCAQKYIVAGMTAGAVKS